MKKKYEKPVIELIDFELSDSIMNDGEGGSLGPILSGEEGFEDW